MKTMKWLLRREFWENKGSMFWAPLIVAMVMLTFIGGTVAYGAATHSLHFGDSVVVNGHEVSKVDALNALPVEKRTEIANIVANSYLAASAPLFGVLPVVVFFYCLAALYDDRRDRSILFWKSLPVSDQMTVLSKVATALIVAPMITIAIGTAVSMLMLLIALRRCRLHRLQPVWPGADEPGVLPGAVPPARPAAGVCAVGHPDGRLAADGIGVGALESVPVGGRRAAADGGAGQVGQLHRRRIHGRWLRRQMVHQQRHHARPGRTDTRRVAADRPTRSAN